MKCIVNVEEKYISLSKDIVDTFINKEGKVVKVMTFSNLSLDKLRKFSRSKSGTRRGVSMMANRNSKPNSD